MTGLEWLLAFLLSFEGSLRANAIAESRLKKLHANADEKAKLLLAIANARSLRNELRTLATDLVRFKSQLGVPPQEGPLFDLLLDEVFQDDLANWLSAANPAEDSRFRSAVVNRMAKALETGGTTPAQIQRFQEEYLEQIERQLFSNTMLANWRISLRIANLQSQLVTEGVATRKLVEEESEATRQAIAALAPSYEADVKQLKERTKLALQSLARTSMIQIREQKVKIPRLSVNAIAAVACDGHVVVLGDPGAGKSVGIHDLAELLQAGGSDIVLIDVQRTAAESLGALQTEFGVTHDLIDVLEYWSGPGYGYLLIDALDAARSAGNAATFNDLIARCIDRLPTWRVVVSVRKYDLRYNPEIRRLFSGASPTQFADTTFGDVRHVNIPVFSDEELDAIGQQSPELQALLVAADAVLRTLLRNPFNLRLMAELLDEGAALDELTPIRSQIELLDRYWQARIIRNDRQADARETLLRRAVQEMISARSLRIDRATLLSDSAASEPLHELLSSNILVEWQGSHDDIPERYILTFSHNILFDYAVERLVFRGDPSALGIRLASEPDLILAIRPSIAFYFHHLWWRDSQHRSFWDTVLDLLGTEEIPRVAQLIGPSVSAELAVSVDDFSPLLAVLKSDDDGTRASAEAAVGHIIGALLATGVSLLGQQGALWCEWAAQIAERMSDETAGPLRALLGSITWNDD